jgi:uncharacterized protein YoxC
MMTVDEIKSVLERMKKELDNITEVLNYIGEHENKGLQYILNHLNWKLDDIKRMIDDVGKALQ